MNKKRNVPWIWSIIILCFLIIGGCGGGGIQPVQVPDLSNAEVLNALVTLMGQQTAPSQHTDPDHPLNLEGETAFAFEIQKRPNVAFTVGFLDQTIQPQDVGEHLRYTLDLTGAPNGNHPIAITAANAAPQRKATRSPVTIQIWIQVQHPYVTITVESIPMHSVQSRQGATYGGLVRIGADSAFDITQTVEVETGTELEIEAQAHEGYLFEGWYLEDTSIATQTLLSILADHTNTYRARFITKTYHSPTIILKSPEDGLKDVIPSHPPKLEWQSHPGQPSNINPRTAPVLTKHEVFIDPHETPTTLAKEIHDPEIMEWQIDSTLAYETTYFWKVVTYQSDGQWTISEIRSFSTQEEEPQTYTLTLESDPPTAGTLTGEGEYPEGTQVQVSATANQGYTFMHWKQEDQVVSAEASFLFSMPSEETTLVAVFERKPEPQAELPHVDLLWLERDTATFSLLWSPLSGTLPQRAFLSIVAEDGQVHGQTEILLHPGEAEEIVFHDLSAGTEYQLLLHWAAQVTNRSGIPLGSVRTFSDTGKGMQIFYWLDLMDYQNHRVIAKCFIQYQDIPSFFLCNTLGHTGPEGIVAENLQVRSSPAIQHEFIPVENQVHFLLGNETKGFILLEYEMEKSSRIVPKDHPYCIYGYLGSEFFLATGSSIMYTPGIFHLEHDDPIVLDNFRFHFYLNKPAHWADTTIWDISEYGIQRISDFYRNEAQWPSAWGLLGSGQIFAYDPKIFNFQSRKFGIMDYNVIWPKSFEDGVFEVVVSMFQARADAYGGYLPQPSFYVIIVPYVDDLIVFGGEFGTGCGWSFHGLEGVKRGGWITHTLNHCWNASDWGVGVRVDEQFYPGDALWMEGFGIFTEDKFYFEKGYTPHEERIMQSCYSTYSELRNTSEDRSILFCNEIPTVYAKSPVFAYYMDRIIRTRTGNTHSVEDIMRFFYREWLELKIGFTFQRMLDFLSTIVPGGMQDWFDAYALENEPVYLWEFEENPPNFSVHSPIPETRKDGIVGENVLLQWQTTHPNPSHLQYDLLFSKTGIPGVGVAPAIATGLSEPFFTVDVEPNQRYKWRVRAYDAQGNTYISPVWFFQSAITTPGVALFFPENHASNLPVQLTLTWEATPANAESINERTPHMIEYHVYLTKANQAYPVPIVAHEKSLLVELDYGTTYTWYVEGIQSDGEIGRSMEWVFTTEDYLFTVQHASVWFNVEDTHAHYHLALSVDPSIQDRITEAWIEGPAWTQKRLFTWSESDQRYFLWEFVPVKNLMPGDLYTIFMNTETSDLYALEVQVPKYHTEYFTIDGLYQDMHIPPNQDLIFSWNLPEGIDSTVVPLWKMDDYGDWVWLWDQHDQPPAHSVRIPGVILDDGVYLARVELKNHHLKHGDGVGYRDIRLFVGDYEPWRYSPPSIFLLSPESKSAGVPRQPTLHWEAFTGDALFSGTRGVTITEYRVHLTEKDAPYSDPVTVIEDRFIPERLDFETEYRWKVEAIQSDGKRQMSDEWFFTTEPWHAFTDPYPQNHAKKVPRSIELAWSFSTTRSEHIYFNLFMGTSQDHLVKQNEVPIAVNQYQIDLEDFNRTYYWRVKAIVKSGNSREVEIEGPIWQFSTVNQYSISDYEAHQIDGDSIWQIIHHEGSIFATGEGGVYAFNGDSHVWTKLYSGFPRRIGFFNELLYIMLYDGLYRLENGVAVLQFHFPSLFGQEDFLIWSFNDFLVDGSEVFLVTMGYYEGSYHEIPTTGIGVIYSQDYGQTWTLLNEGLTNTNITKIKQSKDGNVYCSAIGGLYLLDKDFGQWEKLIDFSNEIGIKKIIEDFDFLYDNNLLVTSIYFANQRGGIYDYNTLNSSLLFYPFSNECIVLSIFVDQISDYILTTHWIDGVYLWDRTNMSNKKVFLEKLIWNTSGVVLEGKYAITGAYGGYYSAFKIDPNNDSIDQINYGLRGNHNIRSAIKNNDVYYFGSTSGYIYRENNIDTFVIVSDNYHAVGEILCMQKSPLNGKVYFQDVDNGLFVINENQVTQIEFTGVEFSPGMIDRISAGLWFRFVDDLLFINNSKNSHLQFSVYQMDEQGYNGSFLYHSQDLPVFRYAFPVYFEIALPYIALIGFPTTSENWYHLYVSEDGGHTFTEISTNANPSLAVYDKYLYYISNEMVYMYNIVSKETTNLRINSALLIFSIYDNLIIVNREKIEVYAISYLGEIIYIKEYMISYPESRINYNVWNDGFSIIYNELYFWDVITN